MNHFSVLMSIYSKTKLSHFEECLDSINNQTLLPSEVIIVQDGDLDYEINIIISKYDKLKITIVVNDKNLGLPLSLNKGLTFCNHDIVFRMDSDDICYLNRFQLQFNKFINNKKLAILGTNVELIDEDSNQLPNLRIVPISDSDIRKLIFYKNPFNHPSIVFRKSIVQSVGSYDDIYLYEDWFLWIKLCSLKNIEVENMDEVLLKYRIRSFNDRKGIKIIKSEFNFYKLLYKQNYIKWNVFIINIIVKSLIRITPDFFYIKIKHSFDKLNSI